VRWERKGAVELMVSVWKPQQLDCAHVEYMRGINNPIGIKISDQCDPAELIELINVINPKNTPGKIMIIVRMGAEKLREHLPRLIEVVEANGKVVVWQSDPMHGNTEKSVSVCPLTTPVCLLSTDIPASWRALLPLLVGVD
jgi:3-deoxy-D-arabino-heptulosonate 7-phosphate (DAHP) synthase class II